MGIVVGGCVCDGFSLLATPRRIDCLSLCSEKGHAKSSDSLGLLEHVHSPMFYSCYLHVMAFDVLCRRRLW